MPEITGLPPLDLLSSAREQLAERFDSTFGGFSAAPKATESVAIERLLRSYARSERSGKPDREALHMACQTLRRMALGGIYDQIGGGFGRYAVDREWMMPHFEKSLIDNALLIRVATDAHRATGDKLFRRIARETSEWALTELQGEHGGFVGNLAATDANGEQTFYLWTPDAMREVLTPAEAELAILRLGLDEKPNANGQWVPQVHMAFSELAKRLQTPRDQVVAQWHRAKAKLLAARNTRERPVADHSIDVAATALMIEALAHAGRYLSLPDLITAAERSETAIAQSHWSAPTFNDQALMLSALMALEQARGQPERRDWIVQLGNALSEPSAPEAEPLADHLQPSAYGVAALALNRLGHWQRQPAYLAAAERLLNAARDDMATDPVSHITLINALEEALDGLEIVIIRAATAHFDPWLEVTDAGYRPQRLVFCNDVETNGPGIPSDEPGAWVIHDGNTLAKATTPTELTDRLNQRP